MKTIIIMKSPSDEDTAIVVGRMTTNEVRTTTEFADAPGITNAEVRMLVKELIEPDGERDPKFAWIEVPE